jgi:hypothetical protein
VTAARLRNENRIFEDAGQFIDKHPSAPRVLFVQLYRWFPSILQALQINRAEMLVRWYRLGFRSYWRWKSRNRGGRPQIDADLRAPASMTSESRPDI